jgi:hypothetical protein
MNKNVYPVSLVWTRSARITATALCVDPMGCLISILFPALEVSAYSGHGRTISV